MILIPSPQIVRCDFGHDSDVKTISLVGFEVYNGSGTEPGNYKAGSYHQMGDLPAWLDTQTTLVKINESAARFSFELPNKNTQPLKGLLNLQLELTDYAGNTNIGNISSFNGDATINNLRPTMTITSTTVNSGSSSSDTEIDLTFTSSEPTDNFELSDITLNNSNGTLSDFATVFTVTASQGKYYINGIQQDSIVLKSGNTYRFDQSDSSNSAHPLKFSTTSDGAHASPAGTVYTTGVTEVGIQGQSGSYTQIVTNANTPPIILLL